MRKGFILLAILSLMIGGGCIFQSDQGPSDCRESEVRRWLNKASQRLEQGIMDMSSMTKSMSSDDFQRLAFRAEARYKDQLEQKTPPCLENLRDTYGELYFAEWKFYVAMSEGNFIGAVKYSDQFSDSLGQAERELDRLRVEYGCDF